jgi:hypothetical protein
MVSRQDHGELMCWVSVDQVLKQATRVKNSLCLSRQDHEFVMEFLEGQAVTKMIFIVELDMVMKESLVI